MHDVADATMSRALFGEGLEGTWLESDESACTIDRLPSATHLIFEVWVDGIGSRDDVRRIRRSVSFHDCRVTLPRPSSHLLSSSPRSSCCLLAAATSSARSRGAARRCMASITRCAQASERARAAAHPNRTAVTFCFRGEGRPPLTRHATSTRVVPGELELLLHLGAPVAPVQATALEDHSQASLPRGQRRVLRVTLPSPLATLKGNGGGGGGRGGQVGGKVIYAAPQIERRWNTSEGHESEANADAIAQGLEFHLSKVEMARCNKGVSPLQQLRETGALFHLSYCGCALD